MQNIKNSQENKGNGELTGLLTEKSAAAYLGLSYETLKRSIRYKNLIPYVKFNKSVRYRQRDLDEFVNKHLILSIS